MPFDPRPAYVKLGIQRDQLRPQLAVLQLDSAPISPALALPAEDEDSHSINEVFRIRMQFDRIRLSIAPCCAAGFSGALEL